MTRFLSLALLFLSAGAFGQGIVFETGDWGSVLDKAKKDKKLIYVDIYTTWCGPCKQLAANIFPQKEAGDKYNKHFVNYRIDAEKGEGITLARQYAVDRYPTHLFIDPVTQKLVYRGTGASPNAADFNHHADLALKEAADPMSLDKYAAKYAAGERSERFLYAYLDKAARMRQPADEALGSYIDIVSKRPPADTTLAFIMRHVSSLDGKAVPYLIANAQMLNATPGGPGINELFGHWINASFEQALKARNPLLLDTMLSRIKRYTGKNDEAMDYWYRTQFYSRTGDQQAAMKAVAAEADYLTAKPLSYFQGEDAKAAAQARQSIRSQLIAMKADPSKLDELVEANMQNQPSMARSSSFFTATTLNGAAAAVLQHGAKDPALVNKAIGWSRRAMELTEGTAGWPSNAGTHAQLLLAAGKKAEALKIQEEAVAKAGQADAPTLKAALESMKAGK